MTPQRIRSEAAAQRLAGPDATVLAMAGRNRRLRGRLKGMPSGRAQRIGHVTNMHDLMQVCDSILTEAGGSR